jgi:hypothetical protein
MRGYGPCAPAFRGVVSVPKHQDIPKPFGILNCISSSHNNFALHTQSLGIMAEPKSTANQRLTKITDFLTMNKTATTIPWDPDCTKFPTRKELPQIPGAPPEAAWVWGDSDYVRRQIICYLCIDQRLTKEVDWSNQPPHTNESGSGSKRDSNWRNRPCQV